MRTIVTAALQRQYSQTDLIFWIIYVSAVFIFIVLTNSDLRFLRNVGALLPADIITVKALRTSLQEYFYNFSFQPSVAVLLYIAFLRRSLKNIHKLLA